MRPLENSDLVGCVPACTVDQLAPQLRDALAVIRDWCETVDIPFHVNCAFRSRAWDLAKGRSGNSSHCNGLAVDLRCVNHAHRLPLLESLSNVGFRRIGIAKTFIHADMDDAKPDSLWLYDPNNLNITF